MVTSALEIVNTNYDEDLQVNPFLIALRENRKEVFKSAVERGWLICVPRIGSFKKRELSEDDFLSHVLVQYNPPENDHHLIQYKTLKNQHVGVQGRFLITSKGFDDEKKVDILFEETFYTPSSKSFKACCINEPLNRPKDANAPSSSYFVLDSVEDCKDLLWGHTGNEALRRKVDGLMHFYFHHIPRSPSNDITMYVQHVANLHQRAFEEVSEDRFLKRAMRNDPLFENYVKLALEMYILNGVYHSLFFSVTDVTAESDAQLNKVTRNWHDIHASKAGIRGELSENIPRARKELAAIPRMTTPLGKCGCLKKVFLCLSTSRFLNNSSNAAITSDDLLTILVFLIIKSDTPNWYAHLSFARHFRFAKSTCDDEYEFYLSTLEAALEHIRGLASKVPEYDTLTLDNPEPAKVESSPINELFRLIERGDVTTAKELIRRGHKTLFGSQTPSSPRPQKKSACHPLCQCAKCRPKSSPSANRKRDRAVTSPSVPGSSVVSVYSKDERDWTALHVACLHGHVNFISWLVEVGAEVDSCDVQGRTPLHLACAQGHQDVIFLLLEAGGQINAADCDSCRPLHLATERGHEQCVKTLLFFGAAKSQLAIDAPNSRGDTALHIAASWGYESLVDLLLEGGVNPLVRNSKGKMPARVACTSRLAEHLRKACSERIPTRSVSVFQSPFSEGNRRASLPVIHLTPGTVPAKDKAKEASLPCSIPVETFPSSGPQSPLKKVSRDLTQTSLSEALDHSFVIVGTTQAQGGHNIVDMQKKVDRMLKAATDGDLQMMKFFLNITGDDDEEEIDFNRELCHPLCQCKKCLPIYKLSLSAASGEIHVNSTNAEGYTCLHVAAIHGHATLTRFLLQRGADPSRVITKQETSPIHLAALHDSLEVLLLLIKHGANVKSCDAQKSQPLHYAARKGCYQCAASLLQHEADVNARNSKGNTPLHEAARSGHVNVVRLLLRQGALPWIRNNQQITALHIASSREVAKLINSVGRWGSKGDHGAYASQTSTSLAKSPSCPETNESGVYSWQDNLSQERPVDKAVDALESTEEFTDLSPETSIQFSANGRTASPTSIQSPVISSSDSAHATHEALKISPVNAYRLVFGSESSDNHSSSVRRETEGHLLDS